MFAPSVFALARASPIAFLFSLALFCLAFFSCLCLCRSTYVFTSPGRGLLTLLPVTAKETSSGVA